ncbi:MAG: IscS subfamily cysteine desulfurase [Legionellaceae bacterium]|nr:IscS subfamily cysteine desulfurase [Legionellaceae bacterium]
MSRLPVYLDYMATTPIDPRVTEKMMAYMGSEGVFGNPASTSHIYGRQAAQAIEQSRHRIAQLLHAEDGSIVFTSGATESDNLAIIGAARFYQNKGRHIITMSTEHKAVLDSFHRLEQEGFRVTYLAPQADGLLDFDALEAALEAETILVSVMHVNNEIGVIQDIARIGRLLKGRGILFHVDAAQSVGKLPIHVQDMSIDLLSASGHKIYGPKGIGFLYVRQQPRVRLQPLSFGGGHEGGLRSGTLATHQIVGLAEAFALAEEEREAEQARILELRNLLWAQIKTLPHVRLNGHLQQRIAGNLNICCSGLDSDSLILSLRELAVSSTSACSSAAQQPSYVLRALGLNKEDAYSSIRLSIGRYTTREQVAFAGQVISEKITRLHEISAE